jgi:hemerythrin-like metal-binding protein
MKDLGDQIGPPAGSVRRLARRFGATKKEVPKTGLPAAFFDKAIEAHIAWRTRLLIAIHGGERPDRERASDPKVCALGEWLTKSGDKLGGMPEFSALVESHRVFHAQVGEVVAVIEAGRLEEAQQLMVAGPLSRTSRATIDLILRLRPDTAEDDQSLPSWSPSLATGQPTIDAQHQELFRGIAALHEAMTSRNASSVETTKLLDYLVSFTKTHFSEEEGLMRRANYPDLERHQGVHRRLIAQLSELQQQRAAGARLSPLDVTAFLAAWLRHHIGEVDQGYVPAMRAAGLLSAAAAR